MRVPSEFILGGVLLPPLLISGLLAVAATSFTLIMLNRYRLSQYVLNPPLAIVAITVIYTVFINEFLISG